MLNPAAAFDYSPRVCELFAGLKHTGSLPDALYAEAGSLEQGASVRLWIQVQHQRVSAARYQAYGCPHFLAACETLAVWLEGRSKGELANWNWREVETELQVPASKRGRLLLLVDALTKLATV